MSGYSAYRFWSPLLGADAVRFSMVGERNAEYFAIVPGGEGRVYRENRDRALDAIEDAIARGDEPGEVRVM